MASVLLSVAFTACAAWLGAWADVEAGVACGLLGSGLVLLDRRRPGSAAAPWLAGAGLSVILGGVGLATGSPQYVAILGLVGLVATFVRPGRPSAPPVVLPVVASLPLALWLAWEAPTPSGGQPVEVLRAVALVAFLVLTGLAFERASERTLASAEEGRRLAVKAGRSRARLLGRVSHALAEPLQGVLELARGLGAGRLPGPARADLELLTASAQTMLGLVTDLLQLAGASPAAQAPTGVGARPRLVLPLEPAPPAEPPGETLPTWRRAFAGRVVAGLAALSAVATLVYLGLGSAGDAAVGLATLAVALAVRWLVGRGRWRAATVSGAILLSALFAAGADFSRSAADLGYLGVAALAMVYVGGLSRHRLVLGVMAVGFGVAVALALQAPGGAASRLDVVRVGFLVPCMLFISLGYEAARARALAEAQAAQAEAEAAAARQQRLLESVSHQLRTPLHGLLGLAQTLWAEVPTEAQRRAVEALARGGSAMHARVNELLDSARSGAGQVLLAPAPVQLGVMLEDVVALARPGAEARGLTLGTALPPSGAWVLADESRLRQVLGALLANATAATARGRVALEATLTPEGEDRVRLAVEVKDTGPGLPPGVLRALGDADGRVEAGQDGVGVGLAVARELALAMGGTLRVTASGPGGSALRLEVPLPRAQPPALPSPLPAPRPARVLVVDDNPVNLTVAARLLSRLGADAVGVPSGEAALAAEGRFDLVLMDLQMPGLDGFETTRRLQAQGLAAPVVALTASAQPETPGQCRAAGMVDCLVKPVKLEQLARLLDGLLP